MALIFNSITQYVIQPERTKKRVKRDDLDTLSEVWTGPSVSEDIFVPLIGTAHPDFSLMTVIDTSTKRMPMLVSEVTIDYQGKLNTSGGGAYSSVPTISTYWAEGEVSYQRAANTSVAGLPGSGFGVLTVPGVATYSHRYTGRCVQIAYLTNRRPTGNPSNIGLAKDYMGFINEWEVRSGFQSGASISGATTPIKQMTCTDVRIEDKAEGWYRVTETYQSRKFPGAVAISQPAASISVNTTSSLGGTGPQWAAAETAANNTYAAAVQAALNLDTPLPSSPSGSAGQAVSAQLGADPAWGSVDSAIPAAADQGGSFQMDTQVGSGSSTLSY